MIPKQIIYPISYIKPFILGSLFKYKENFLIGITSLLKLNNKLIPLGRARAGIYMLIKESIEHDKKEVILSPYTIPDVINMVIFAGGIPVFVDFLPKSTNIDTNLLSDLINDRTACVLITHYHVCQNNAVNIKILCSKRGVMLYEDCAISLGGVVDSTPVGEFSDAGILSFSSFKALNFFWGGALIVKNRELRSKVLGLRRGWRNLGASDYFQHILRTLRYDILTSRVLYPFFIKTISFLQKKSNQIDELSIPRIESKTIDKTLLTKPSDAAYYEWFSKLDRVLCDLEHRRKIASIYDEFLGVHRVSAETHKNIIKGSCFVNYPIFVQSGIRDMVYKELLTKGFHVGLSLYPNCANYKEFSKYGKKMDNIDNLIKSVITFPTHPRVTDKYAKSIAIEAINIIKRLN